MTTSGTNPDPHEPGDIGDGGTPVAPELDAEQTISPAIYRAVVERAEQAEGQCAEHQATIAQLEQQLAEARASFEDAEQRHQLDLLLIEADAIDLDTTRLLLERALTDHEGHPADAIDALKRSKPFLFRNAQPTTPSLGAMPAEPDLALTNEGHRLLELAEQAAERGDRKAVLRYLQARRGK